MELNDRAASALENIARQLTPNNRNVNFSEQLIQRLKENNDSLEKLVKAIDKLDRNLSYLLPKTKS